MRFNQAIRVRSTTADQFLDAPASFHEMEAAWSALSPTPGPLRIEVDSHRLDKEWM